MNVQHKATILIGCALCWTFIGSAVLCHAYAGYVILCAIALTQRFERSQSLQNANHANATITLPRKK